MRGGNKMLFKKMSEMTTDNSYIDMHMHTTWTDGKNTLKEMVTQAEKNSLLEIAITDHIRSKSDYFFDYIVEIKKIREEHHINILAGFEAKIKNLDGEVDVPKEALKMADFVIASVHRLPFDNNMFKYPKELNYNELAVLEKKLSLKAIKRGKDFDVLGHCGGMTIATYGEYPLEYFEEVIQACKEYNIVFEFNYKYHHLYENEIKKLLYKYDPYISVGSDAHDIFKLSKRSFIHG